MLNMVELFLTMAIGNSTDLSKAQKEEGELSNREEIEADGHDDLSNPAFGETT